MMDHPVVKKLLQIEIVADEMLDEVARAARRRGRFAGYALATLLAVTMTLSCTEGSVGPAANVQDPGFLTVEWTGPAAGRGIGVLLELEGPGIEAVRAPGFELYESRRPGGMRSSWRDPSGRVPSCSSGSRTGASCLCTGSASSRSRERITSSGTQGSTGP